MLRNKITGHIFMPERKIYDKGSENLCSYSCKNKKNQCTSKTYERRYKTMKYELYQAFDKLSGESIYPIMTFHNEKEAIRTFAYHVEEACAKRPALFSLPQVIDLELYKIGEQTSGSMKIEISEKILVARATDYVDCITIYKPKNKIEGENNDSGK